MKEAEKSVESNRTVYNHSDRKDLQVMASVTYRSWVCTDEISQTSIYITES